MSNTKPTPEQAMSILSLGWQLLVITPIWFAMQYMILDALGDAVSWKTWALFFVYVPATVLGIILFSVTRIILDGKE
jgi:anaerobic C4-dicarboxylate transporter